MKMKTIRSSWPKVRQYVKRGQTYFMVDLRRKHYSGPKWKNFTDRDTALTFASDIGSKVSKSGLNSITTVNEDPRLKAWTEQAAIFGKTVDEVFAIGFDVLEKQRKVKDSPFISELLTLWVDDKTTNVLKPLRQRTASTIRHMANMFKEDFKDAKVKEFDEPRLDKYLKDKKVSNQTRKNIRNYLGQFFNWATKKKYADHNPVEHIEIHVQNGTPEFYTVDECQNIMRVAKNHPKMTAYVSLCLFGGVRPEESQRLTWANIKMDTKEVFIPASVSKTKKDRMFVMSENLHQWLSICDQNEPLIPVNFRKLKDGVIHGVKKLKVDWIQDGLRHSFSTYHYALHKNLETLRHIMGNSPNVIEKFYRGAISQTEVDKFWGITPTSLTTK
jgi:integrase